MPNPLNYVAQAVRTMLLFANMHTSSPFASYHPLRDACVLGKDCEVRDSCLLLSTISLSLSRSVPLPRSGPVKLLWRTAFAITVRGERVSEERS